MKPIQFAAVGLLGITGLLHVAQLATYATNDPTIGIAIAFGVIYLVLGLLLISGRRIVVWLAAIVPLVGLLPAAAGMVTKPTLLGIVFIAIDVGISACCFTLLFHQGQKQLPM